MVILRDSDNRQRIQLHLRIRTSDANRRSFLDFLREAIPVYKAPGGIDVLLLQNLRDPERYIEVIDYDGLSAYEADQLRVANDPAPISLLERWRGLLNGRVEVETYRNITDEVGL